MAVTQRGKPFLLLTGKHNTRWHTDLYLSLTYATPTTLALPIQFFIAAIKVDTVMKKVGEGSSRTIDGHGSTQPRFTQGASDIPDTLSVEYLLSDDSPRVPFSSRSSSFTHDGDIRIVNVKYENANRNKGSMSVRPNVGPVGKDRGGVTKCGSVVRESTNKLKRFPKYPSERKDDVKVPKKVYPLTINRRDSKTVNVLERKDGIMKKFDLITFNQRDSEAVNGLKRTDDFTKKFGLIVFDRRDSKAVTGLERKDDVMKKFDPRDSKATNGSERKDDVTKKFDSTAFNRRDSKAVNGLERKDDVMKKFDLIAFNRGSERKDDVTKKFDPIMFSRRDSKAIGGSERKDDVTKKFESITYNRRETKAINDFERKDDVMKKLDSTTSNRRDPKAINGLERKDDVVKKLDSFTSNRRDPKAFNGSTKRKNEAISIRDLVSDPKPDKKPRILLRLPIKKETTYISKMEYKAPKVDYKVPKLENKMPKIEDKYKVPNFKEFSFLKSTPLGVPKQSIHEDTSGPARPIAPTVSNGNSVGALQISPLNTPTNQMGAGCSRIRPKEERVKLEDGVEVKSTTVGVQKQNTDEDISRSARLITSTVSNGKLVGASQISTVKTPINSVGASQISTLITPINSVGASQISTLNTPINQMGVGCSRIRPKDERVKLEDAVEDLSQSKTEATLKHQRIALSWMVNQETNSTFCCGGILADDQVAFRGLGKTISTISLILKERSPSSKSPKPNEAQQSDVDMLNSVEDRRPPAGTLIVCPTSVLRQWSQELVNKVAPEADLSVLVYHGSNRTKDPVELAKYDVVVTTYALVGQEVPMEPAVNEKDDPDGDPFHIFKKKKKHKLFQNRKPGSSKKIRAGLSKKKSESTNDDDDDDYIISGPLGMVGWFRVVLDEAQCIKNHRTMTARACWGLHAKRRWCLSGTPIQNTVEDLYSYFRFLKYDPYADFRTFCIQIKSDIQYNNEGGYKRLQAVLKTFLLRRTKSTIIDGQRIIILPPKTIELQKIEFTKEERDFYVRLESDSRTQFQEYAAAGTVRQNYAIILVMLLRLRQACGHPCLVNMLKYNSQSTSSVETAKKLPRDKQMSLLNCLEASSSICGICNDSPEDAVVTVCGHVYCHQCICELMIGDDTECPADNCETNLVMACVFSKDTLRAAMSTQEIVKNNTNEAVSDSRSSTCPQTSSKIKATLKLLLSISKPQRKNETTSETSDFVGGKAIVFSQWTKMLDLLEDSLKEYSIEYRRLDGTMPVSARDRAVKDFNTLPQVTVMIMSLKAASLGLNMVAANNVILLDLWWNPTTEDQAIDRAHRIGQTRPVSVYRLTVEETVEDRILALQQKKRDIVSSAFGEEGTGGGQQTRLSVQELSYLFKA
ncbi:uncharacterized ATP-dependent helicase c23e6.02 [Phtheirospermum japonicum]|uniref:Uncharacterized ATP-dependent helicase c23e6.02 n=1 Tax=Phtheirospermum japonicum TaxID=374723 RepID=A0A830CQ56_9LAMI|nr:uncharacterized ATP-dependent helicase c23e6.02 [Phtheirospermum japonicum]